MATKYTVPESAVRERDGAAFSVDAYKEGVDYVQRKCFSSFKRVYRSDILGMSVVDPSRVEHKQEVHTIDYKFDDNGSLEVVGSNVELSGISKQLPTPEDWQPSMPVVSHDTRQKVQECKICRIHPNFKWVETDKGRVWVGLKGINMKRGQIIRVRDGELFLGKTEASPCLTRV